MKSDTFKPNVQELQQDVIDLLRQIADLSSRANAALNVDCASQKDGFQQVNEATRNVEELELRMAIIAPMKAGKSTIINSIIGQELLPSRHTAMTTLPTEIVFKAELTEPTLTLSPKILAVFQTALMVLRWQFKVLGSERMQEKMAQYPHLLNLLELINDTVEPLRVKTSGRVEIRQALTLLNDIIRLCSLLNPAQDPIAQLIDVPCVETPFWQQGELSARLGNLVIVDTPGPNEAGAQLKLTAIVEEQLQRSSIVLIVLDFTQLNNQAAEAIKEQVEPVFELLSKENLYVLVNKVDQRRQGDLSAEQVKEFVFADLGLSIKDTERVFEVSAIQAFAAARFLQERQQNPNGVICEMESAEALAQEALGARWETKLQQATINDLRAEADYLWEDSGFRPFLEKAIHALCENAAPRCMMSALNLSRNLLVELRDDLNLRHSAIAQDEERLRREISALEADCKRLELGRDRLKAVEHIQAELQENLDQILATLKQTAQVRIEDYFIEDGYASQLQDLPLTMKELFVKSLADFDNFPQWISPRINANLIYKSFGKFEFYTQQEAEEFADQAVAWSKQRAEVLLMSVCQVAEKEMEKAWTNLTDFLVEETTPILEQARSRIQKAFRIELPPLPQPTFEHPKISGVQTLVDHESKQITDYTVKEYRPFYLLFLVKVEKKVPIIKTESFYTVSIEGLAALINNSIEASVTELHQEISQYLEQEFQQRIDDYFVALDRYLRNYRDSLKQAQQDQQLSLEAEKQLVGTLNYLVPETTAKLKKAEIYLERTNYLLNAS